MLKIAEFRKNFDARAFWRGLPYINFLITLLPLYAMIITVLAVFGGGDDAVYEYFKFYRYRHLELSRWLEMVSRWGNPLLYAVYGAFIVLAAWGKIDRRRFLALGCAWLVTELLLVLAFGKLLKYTIGRPRPHLETDIFRSFTSGHHSMPSGHTYDMVNSLLTLGFFRKYALSFICGIFLAAMGFSRIYLTAHFVSDVAAAPLLGVTAAVFTLFLREYFYFRFAGLSAKS